MMAKPIKMKLSYVELDCTRYPVTKAFEATGRDLTTNYTVTEVTFKVTWEARGSSTSTATHARLTLQRQNLKTSPSQAPISLHLAHYDSSKQKKATEVMTITEADKPLLSFWKPAQPGKFAF